MSLAKESVGYERQSVSGDTAATSRTNGAAYDVAYDRAPCNLPSDQFEPATAQTPRENGKLRRGFGRKLIEGALGMDQAHFSFNSESGCAAKVTL